MRALACALLAMVLLSSCGLGLRPRFASGVGFARELQRCGSPIGDRWYVYEPRVVGPGRVATRVVTCRRRTCISDSRLAYFVSDPNRHFELRDISIDDALLIAGACFAGRVEGTAGLNQSDRLVAIGRRGEESVLYFEQCNEGSEWIVRSVERDGEIWLSGTDPATRTWVE